MTEQNDLERDLRVLESNLRKLETEYTMFFGGHLPRPPVETRARVERLFRRYDRVHIQSYADRFRLTTLQARFSTFADLWDRGLRAREEGRPGPFSRPPRDEPPATTAEPVPVPDSTPPAERVLCMTTLSDPPSERDKMLALYESLIEARHATGHEDAFPFSRFAAMVAAQVARLTESGSREVAFRVAVKDNKAVFTARGLKGDGERTEK